MTDRIIAVGDIHGCSTALRTLLEAIRPTQKDTIVTLGDYIDRGPDSRGVLEQLIKLHERCHLVPLLGNHEEMLLAALESRNERDFWLRFGGREALNSYGTNAGLDAIPSQHLDFIRNCRRFYEDGTHLYAHANYWPNLPLDEQSTSVLLWENLDKEKVRPHYSGKTAVVGHTPQVNGQIVDLGFVVGIDTLCHDGGWLTALETTNGNYWQTNQQGLSRQGRLRPRTMTQAART